MKIAIRSGTGKLRLAFAPRLSQSGHEVTIGPREAVKAEEAANTIPGIRGVTNSDAASWCDAALVSVPYAGHGALFESLRDSLRGKIVIDATVPIDPANMLQIKTQSGKSAAEEAASLVPDADVFAAFQTVSHRVLRQRELTHDVLVAGSASRKGEVMELVRTKGLHSIDAGPIELADYLERMTVLLFPSTKPTELKRAGSR